ncbi:MAG: diphosphate--fructose-6-phosphate 1-phosphotransferase, partial [Chloroflexi bacterium]|nr:diphosphate--fructose-6-phosphate 1-phosphotransferase [Chloroflexota bacterium]
MAGKLLVGQAGGATAVINSSLAGIVEEAQRQRGFDAIWGVRRGAEGALQGDFVDLGSLSASSLAALARTPGAALASSRHKLSDEEVDVLLDLFRRHDVRAFLYIGGNDSADSAHRVARRARERAQGLCAIAVPKTIDNDLPVTDHSPGYGSIARYIAVATMDSARDTESMPTMYPVKVIEVMGRDAGWVVAASTLGKRQPQDAPHLLYLPERPVSRGEMLRDVERVHGAYGRVVAVVAETLRDERGRPFADPEGRSERDAFGHPLIRGTAESICRLIQEELGLRARFDRPGSLQRMSMLCTSPIDLQEAAEAGRAAVRLAMSGETNRMVTLVRDGDRPYRWHTGSVSLAEVANRQKLLPPGYLTADGRQTTEGFRAYALPLLGPDPFPHYVRL